MLNLKLTLTLGILLAAIPFMVAYKYARKKAHHEMFTDISVQYRPSSNTQARKKPAEILQPHCKALKNLEEQCAEQKYMCSHRNYVISTHCCKNASYVPKFKDPDSKCVPI